LGHNSHDHRTPEPHGDVITQWRVLVAGGYDGTNYLSTAELYDPAAGIWTPTGTLNFARRGHTAAFLPNGRVLVVGGVVTNGTYLVSAESYDPATGKWALAVQ